MEQLVGAFVGWELNLRAFCPEYGIGLNFWTQVSSSKIAEKLINYLKNNDKKSKRGLREEFELRNSYPVVLIWSSLQGAFEALLTVQTTLAKRLFNFCFVRISQISNPRRMIPVIVELQKNSLN